MTSHFKLLFRIFLLLAGVIFLAEAQAQYNIVDRFQILEDKFRTQEMLRPHGHDFYLDIVALANTDVMDFIDEADEVANFQGSESEQITRAQQFLRQYNQTEQNLRIGVGLGIPIFSFTAFGIKFKPSLRANFNLGFLMGIQTSNLTTAQAIEYLGNDLDPLIKNKLNNCVSSFSPSTTLASRDIVKFMVDNAALCQLSATEQAYLTPFIGQYYFPEDTTVPDIYNYIKGEGRVGLNFDYIYDKHFFGSLNIYALGRADYSVRISADALTNDDSDIADLPDELNTTVNMALDYRLGYKNGNLTGIVGLEDVKIARMSDSEAEAGALLYGEDMLIRFHGEYLYKYSLFSVKPFVGLHKRSSYGIGDGYYAGADLGMHVWEDRIGLRFRGMLDSEHVTFAPRMDLWLLELEYMLKQPIKSDVDGIKPSTIHSLNLRIAI
jgi:hypothetical protein